MSCGCRPDAPSVEAQAEVEAKGETKGEAESGVRRRVGQMGEGGWHRGRKREDDSQSTGGAQPSQVITASVAEAMTGMVSCISKERYWRLQG